MPWALPEPMMRGVDLQEALGVARDAAVAVELDAPTTLRLVGRDLREALNRVVTQEVRALTEGELRLALLLAPKGQFRALMAIGVVDAAVVISVPAGRADAVRERLATYLSLSRIAIERESWLGGGLAVLGPGAAAVASRLVPGAAPGRIAAAGAGGGQLLACGEAFLGAPAVVVASSTAEAYGQAEAELAAAGVPLAPRELLELVRVERGFPAWGAELTDTVLPPEVGLDATAVSYTKGCYVGQETMARMKTYGHPNRTLAVVRQVQGSEAPPPLPLELTVEGEERVRGELTSAVRILDTGVVGLALLRREAAAPGTTLVGGDRVYVVTAPR